jgi:translation initiation factor IF-1
LFEKNYFTCAFPGASMKLVLVFISFFIFFSCSHLNKVKPTDKKNMIIVQITDTQEHKIKIGDNVKVFNWVSRARPRRLKDREISERRVKENEVQGKIIEILSDEQVKVELTENFLITDKTRAEY